MNLHEVVQTDDTHQLPEELRMGFYVHIHGDIGCDTVLLFYHDGLDSEPVVRIGMDTRGDRHHLGVNLLLIGVDEVDIGLLRILYEVSGQLYLVLVSDMTGQVNLTMLTVAEIALEEFGRHQGLLEGLLPGNTGESLGSLFSALRGSSIFSRMMRR